MFLAAAHLLPTENSIVVHNRQAFTARIQVRVHTILSWFLVSFVNKLSVKGFYGRCFLSRAMIFSQENKLPDQTKD